MSKKFTLILSVLFLYFVGYSQTTEAEKSLKTHEKDTINGWTTGGNFSLNFSQVQLINWAGGGLNSVAGNASINIFSDYKKNELSWKNALILGYGVIRQGDKDARWLKSDDRIDLTSKVEYEIKENLYFGVLYNFRSQFAPGYSDAENHTLISKFAAPAYSILAIGFDYSPNKVWSAFLAPVTIKTTLVLHDSLANAGAFGVKAATYDDLGMIITPGKQYRNEFGGYFRFKYKRDLMKNVNFETNLDLFSNYLNNPQNVDVNWQVLIAMKINEFLTATLTTNLIYDDDIDIAVDKNDDGIIDSFGPRTQFKEAFGLGISYQF